MNLATQNMAFQKLIIDAMPGTGAPGKKKMRYLHRKKFAE